MASAPAAYLLRRLDHQMLTAPDPGLEQLAGETRSYPGVAEPGHQTASPADRVFVPLHLRNGQRDLRLLNMVATFGTALDVTAAELVIEAFYPADPATAQALQRPTG